MTVGILSLSDSAGCQSAVATADVVRTKAAVSRSIVRDFHAGLKGSHEYFQYELYVPGSSEQDHPAM
jgi:hypothetical protein